jgi:hypothetical protein
VAAMSLSAAATSCEATIGRRDPNDRSTASPTARPCRRLCPRSGCSAAIGVINPHAAKTRNRQAKKFGMLENDDILVQAIKRRHFLEQSGVWDGGR